MTDIAVTADVYPRRWWAFSVLALAVLIVVLDHMVLNVALPTLQRQMGATISELQWIVDAYSLAFAALLLTMGALGDRLGQTTMLRLGMFTFGAASMGAVFSRSAGHLIAARAFMGIGAAMIMPATLATISNIFPIEERGKALGAWGAMNGLGVALGPFLGGLLLAHFDWSAVFFINVPVVIVALVAGYFLIPKSSHLVMRHFDLPGVLLSSLSLFLLIFGIIKWNDCGWSHPLVYGALALSVVAGFFFILRERKIEAPMLDIGLFSNPELSSGSGSIAIMAFAMFGVLFGLTLYLQFVKRYSPMETGVRFLPLAIGYALGSLSSNRNTQRWGKKNVVTAGFMAMAILLTFMAFWEVDTPFWCIGSCVFLLGFSLGNIMAPALGCVLIAVPAKRAGVGSALGNISFQVGGALGVAFLGAVLNSVYQTRVESLLSTTTLPAQVVSLAMESIGKAVITADGLALETRQQLSLAANSAFMEGWRVMLLSVSAIGITGICIVKKFMPVRHY